MSGDIASGLNGDCKNATVDAQALDDALKAAGDDVYRLVRERCPHLFSTAPFFISSAQLDQMRAVVAAVERVVALPAWHEAAALRNPAGFRRLSKSRGVFMGYDFHLNAEGAHLIEINTNAGGGFLNNLLIDSQRLVPLPGEPCALDNLEAAFLEMFLNEWRLERGDAPLKCVAIVDDAPRDQYLYPEFLLAQRMFLHAGIDAIIADPAELDARPDGLYCAGKKVDLVYNRLTDFYLARHTALDACLQNAELAVISPHPQAYALYADKYNLTVLTSADHLRTLEVDEETIAILQAGIPECREVEGDEREAWWQERKQWFFKPATGFGSRGAYRGANVTRRVFDEIMAGGYVAQRLAVPGERAVCGADGEVHMLKSDVRCYAYDGRIQLVAARLYQGQTTNFRTEYGGFSQVRSIDGLS